MNEPVNEPGTDSGYVLAATVVAITLMAIAAMVYGRVFGVQLRASIQERLVIEERTATRNAERVIDAWMADPEFSKDITEEKRGESLWRKPDGSVGCSPPTDTVCWAFTVTDPTAANPLLRGNEAEQDIRTVDIEVRTGCTADIDSCQRATEITRTYERAVFAHYQMHYANHNTPPAIRREAVARLRAAETAAEQAIRAANPSWTDDQVTAEVALDPEVRYWTQWRDDLPLPVVFTSADTLNGPLRHSGPGAIWYCGSPEFKLIESKSPNRPVRADASCPSQPSWLDDTTNPPTPVNWPVSDTDLLDANRFVVRGDELDLPAISAPTGPGICTLAAVNYHHVYDSFDKTRREANPGVCPGEPTQSTIPHAILDGDIIVSNGPITIERLVVDGSVTVYAAGDITVCGDVEAAGTNLAGGPNVVALIAEGAVILDPGGTVPPACDNGTLTALTALQDISLTNVAVLAPRSNGTAYARGWHLPCNGTCPTLTIEGSVAANHLGLYGIPNPSGAVTNGWTKSFAYPTDDPNTTNINEAFWRARPPWWPDFTGNEWEPA